eukprot:TRINITY_DN24195_c0_g1_i3.p1 TRINITY_DN24195_c0_g1~~TRINITY_DN24195_c0_g1_i3.p1  ORF type:complete len:419 (+),score=83.35 TRINITY_DN24195_c0_g1_i3:79-1335(+)
MGSLVLALLALVASANADTQLLKCKIAPDLFPELRAQQGALQLDIWQQHPDGHVDVRAPRDVSMDPKFDCSVELSSVEREVGGSRGAIGEGKEPESGWFERYHRFDEITAKLHELATAHPNHMKLIASIGETGEGRKIPVVVISPDGQSSAARTQIWISGGQHAREWAAPSTVMRIVKELAAAYKSGEHGDDLAQLEFHVAPVLNPDGYEYSHTADRLWRKNRRENSDGSYGVDLNRNWPNHWGEDGGSGTKEQDYQGTAEASEPEVQAVMKYMHDNLPSAAAGIDYHSYGKMILRSPGWRRGNDKDEHMLRRLGGAMRDGTASAGGGSYKSMHAADLYPCTGAMDDWMSEQVGMWGHGWTVELPSGGQQFMLPEADLEKVTTGAFEGLLRFVKQLREEKRRRSQAAVQGDVQLLSAS